MAAKVAYAVTTNTPQIKQNTNYGNDVIINSVMTIKNPTKKTFDNCKIINIDYENHTVDAECGKMKALKSTNDKSPSEERLAKYIPSPATTSEGRQAKYIPSPAVTSEENQTKYSPSPAVTSEENQTKYSPSPAVTSEGRQAKYSPSPATTSEEKQEPGVMNKIKALFHLCTF